MRRRGFLAGIAALVLAPRLGLEKMAPEDLEDLDDPPELPARFPAFPRTTTGITMHFGTDEIRAALFTSEAA